MISHQSYNTSHNKAQITRHGYPYKSIMKRPNDERQVIKLRDIKGY